MRQSPYHRVIHAGDAMAVPFDIDKRPPSQQQQRAQKSQQLKITGGTALDGGKIVNHALFPAFFGWLPR